MVEPMRDLPMGFGMALLQNGRAAENFSEMTPEQRQQVISHTHGIHSKAEMKAFVAKLGESQNLI